MRKPEEIVVESIEPKNGNGHWLKALVVVVVAGISSISTVLVNRVVIDPRPDAITATQVEVIRLQLIADFETKVRAVESQCRDQNRELMLRRPPINTRKRIVEIEHWIERQDVGWNPPTEEWGD
jgi:hypothetical protein